MGSNMNPEELKLAMGKIFPHNYFNEARLAIFSDDQYFVNVVRDILETMRSDSGSSEISLDKKYLEGRICSMIS